MTVTESDIEQMIEHIRELEKKYDKCECCTYKKAFKVFMGDLK